MRFIFFFFLIYFYTLRFLQWAYTPFVQMKITLLRSSKGMCHVFCFSNLYTCSRCWDLKTCVPEGNLKFLFLVVLLMTMEMLNIKELSIQQLIYQSKEFCMNREKMHIGAMIFFHWLPQETQVYVKKWL